MGVRPRWVLDRPLAEGGPQRTPPRRTRGGRARRRGRAGAGTGGAAAATALRATLGGIRRPQREAGVHGVAARVGRAGGGAGRRGGGQGGVCVCPGVWRPDRSHVHPPTGPTSATCRPSKRPQIDPCSTQSRPDFECSRRSSSKRPRSPDRSPTRTRPKIGLKTAPDPPEAQVAATFGGRGDPWAAAIRRRSCEQRRSNRGRRSGGRRQARKPIGLYAAGKRANVHEFDRSSFC